MPETVNDVIFDPSKTPARNVPTSGVEVHTPPSRKPSLWFLVGGVLVLAVAAFFIWRYMSQYESTDDAQVDGHVNPISTRVSGYVLRVDVNDNQFVEKGAPLVQI